MPPFTSDSGKPSNVVCPDVSLDRRVAFTLVELLVALAIAAALTAIALPTLKESLRQNSLGRAASLVKGAFLNARTQAIRTGRPFGIVIERRRHEIGAGPANTLDFTIANYATRMYYVQSPLEYRGEFDGAVAYPIFEDSNTASNTDPLVPRFFVPLSSGGLLFAAADGSGAANSSAAKNLINIGTRFSVGVSDYAFEVTGLEQVALSRSNTSTAFGSRELYHPQVEPINGPPFPNPIPPVQGTLISFNYIDFAPRYGQALGQYDTVNNSLLPPYTIARAAANSKFPASLPPFQGAGFKFRTNPIKAPLAPVTMIGKTVIDLSVSGTSENPVAFNAHAIVDPIPNSDIPDLNPDVLLNDILVMFAPDGKLDGVYHDRRTIVGSGPGARIAGFEYIRVDPSAGASFNIGYVDGLVDHIDDMARYPEHVPGTGYTPNPNDPVLATPAPPSALQVTKIPNFANTDCAWINVQPTSGNITLDNIASQPTVNWLSTYYGYSATPNSQAARAVVRDRMLQSRRLAKAGTVQ